MKKVVEELFGIGDNTHAKPLDRSYLRKLVDLADEEVLWDDRTYPAVPLAADLRLVINIHDAGDSIHIVRVEEPVLVEDGKITEDGRRLMEALLKDFGADPDLAMKEAVIEEGEPVKVWFPKLRWRMKVYRDWIDFGEEVEG